MLCASSLLNKELSINDGAIVAINLDDDSSIISTQISTVAKFYNIDLNKKVKELSKKELDIILYGSKDLLEFNYVAKNGNKKM